MANWKDQIYGFGGNTESLSEGSPTVQLSLVDANMEPIPVTESREDFVMKIPIPADSIEPPINISEFTIVIREGFCCLQND